MADIITAMIEQNTENIHTSGINLITTVKNSIKTSFLEVIEHFNKVGETYTRELNTITNNMNILTNENCELKKTVSQLEKDIKDNKFNEENFNKVSIVRELSKQISELNNRNWELETKIKSLEKRLCESSVRNCVAEIAPVVAEIAPVVAEVAPVVAEVAPKPKTKRSMVKKTVALTELPNIENENSQVNPNNNVGVVVVNNPASHPAPETKKKTIVRKKNTTVTPVAPVEANVAPVDANVAPVEAKVAPTDEEEIVEVNLVKPDIVLSSKPENENKNIKKPTKTYTVDDYCDIKTVNGIDYYIFDSIYAFVAIEDSGDVGEFVGNYVMVNNTITFINNN